MRVAFTLDDFPLWPRSHLGRLQRRFDHAENIGRASPLSFLALRGRSWPSDKLNVFISYSRDDLDSRTSSSQSWSDMVSV